jgi:SAM-dependent methyltransferase
VTGEANRAEGCAPPAPPLGPVALISAAALAYEVLLIRLLAIVQWHHFAYMIISLALLGYGASGSLLALAGAPLLKRFPAAFTAGAALFAASAALCFLLGQALPFNPLELPWDPWQLGRLAAIYLLLAVPFLFAAGCVCLALERHRESAHRVYAADILGAGAGSLGVLGLLYLVPPLVALKGVVVLGMLAAAWSWRGQGLMPRAGALAPLAAGAALFFLLPAGSGALRPSEYKELSQLLQVQGVRMVEERWSPLGWIATLESPRVPFRHAPGLSLNAPAEPPAQMGVLTDGEGFSPIVGYDGQSPPAYLGYLTSALPYALLDRPRVLVLGAGGGGDVLQALALGAASVDAVEINPQVVDLVREHFGGFSGDIYRRARVHIAEARGFVERTGEQYDLIQVALLDSFGAAAAGVHSLAESYLYTVQGMGAYLRRLAPGGMLAITRWVTLPPRDPLKLFATAAEALRAAGAPDPGAQLAMIRSWKTATLLVKNSALEPAEIAALKHFCESRGFDLAWYPGMGEEEANRFNLLERPWFYEGAVALLSPQREEFVQRYKFDIRPATDDRPFFFNFFRWRVLPELLALRGQGGLPLLDWGYPVLVATLSQALAASVLFILLPLWAARARAGGELAHPGQRLRVVAYFAAIGFAFMFVEMAMIQKFVLFLAHPLHAAAAVIAAFLVFAGLGSRSSAGFARLIRARLPGWPPVAVAVALILAMILLYAFVLPGLFRLLAALPQAARVAATVALVAPLAFWMGMPLPLVIGRLSGPQLIAWAWGVNGFASVMGAVLATLLAIHLGFSRVLGLAALLYVAAAASAPRAGATTPTA